MKNKQREYVDIQFFRPYNISRNKSKLSLVLVQSLQIMLCIPSNTSPVERGYTYLQMIANKQRNQLSNEQLKALFLTAALKLPAWVWTWNYTCRGNSVIYNKLMTVMQKNTKVLATKLSLQTEKSTVIIILQDNNKNNKSNKIIINQPVPREMSKYFCSKAVYHVMLLLSVI